MKSAILMILLASGLALAQSNSGPILDPAPTAKKPKKRSQPPTDPSAVNTPVSQPEEVARPESAAAAAENAANESSSRDTLLDLSVPTDDAKTHPGAQAETGINEFHAYDPHKAMKNIEVGDYYAKRKNLAAAISRYREALQYKPHDAEATFKLAGALERMGENDEAAEGYSDYLKVLPNGAFAAQAKSALQRLNEKSASSAKAAPAEKVKR